MKNDVFVCFQDLVYQGIVKVMRDNEWDKLSLVSKDLFE